MTETTINMGMEKKCKQNLSQRRYKTAFQGNQKYTYFSYFLFHMDCFLCSHQLNFIMELKDTSAKL